jgi:hypothetical protein
VRRLVKRGALRVIVIELYRRGAISAGARNIWNRSGKSRGCHDAECGSPKNEKPACQRAFVKLCQL